MSYQLPSPWLIDIDPFNGFVQSTVASPWTLTMDGTACYQAFVDSGAGAAQNDTVSFDVVLGKGTWDIVVMHLKGGNRCIYTVQLDGVDVGTFDGYNATTLYNQYGTVTGVAVTWTGKHRLTLKAATKNASSSGYRMYLHHLQLRRTA